MSLNLKPFQAMLCYLIILTLTFWHPLTYTIRHLKMWIPWSNEREHVLLAEKILTVLHNILITAYINIYLHSVENLVFLSFSLTDSVDSASEYIV